MKKLSSVLIVFLLFLVVNLPVYAENAVVINEVLIHPNSAEKEWVELYNPTLLDLSSYWIDDDTDFFSDSGNSDKKSLTTVQQGSDVTHWFFQLSATSSASMFNNTGDSVVLFDSMGDIVDYYTYSHDPGVDVSIGRTPDGTGSFAVLATATKGQSNSTPVPTATVTPTPTSKPTKTPTPTKYPTPTKVPTPISSVSNSTEQPVKSRTEVLDYQAEGFAYEASMSAPTSVFGISTQSARENISPTSDATRLMGKSPPSSKHALPVGVFIVVGGILIGACAILIFLQMRKRRITDE